MSNLSSLTSSSVKLRWGRPLGRSVAKLDITETGGKDGHSTVARLGASGTECTVCTSTGICTFGICDTVFAIDAAGDASKPTVVGFVPRDYWAFDGMISKENGGFGVSAKGDLVGFENVGNKGGGSLAFASGDKVHIKLDFLEGLASVSVESSAGKKKASDVVVGFDPRAMHGVCFPACSLGSSGAAVSVDKVTDLTELDSFTKKLTGGAHMKGGKTGPSGEAYYPDAFGSFWMRLYCRMKDSDSVKVQGLSSQLKRDDVLAQMLLCGVDQHHQATAAAVAGTGECPALERARNIYFHATNALFAGRSGAGALKDALSKAPLPLVAGQGGSYSPFAFFAAALVNHMEEEKNATIKQIEHMLLSLGKRVDSLDGQSTGGLSKGGGGDHGGSSSFLPDISKRTGSVAAPAAKSGHKAPAPKPAAKTTTAFKDAPKAAPKAPGAKPAAKPGAKPSAGGGGGSTPTGNNIMATIRQLRKRAEEIHTLSQKGSPTDDDLKKLDEAKSKMSKEKMAAAKTLNGLSDTSAALKSLDDDAKQEICDFYEDMVGEGDHIDGNLELAQALVYKVPLDWAEFVGGKHLDSVAAYDGSLDYLELFLGLEGLETDVVDLMQNAMFNQSRRIPAVLAVLKFEGGTINLGDAAEEIQDSWQEFFDDIASAARSIPKEVREGRTDLLEKMLAGVGDGALTVDPLFEGGDGQTAFSRAAKEGDIALMKLLLKMRPDLDVGKVSTDTTTALIQAVIQNEVESVKFVLSHDKKGKNGPNGANVGHVSSEGSALFLARALHRDAAIIKALEAQK